MADKRILPWTTNALIVLCLLVQKVPIANFWRWSVFGYLRLSTWIWRWCSDVWYGGFAMTSAVHVTQTSTGYKVHSSLIRYPCCGGLVCRSFFLWGLAVEDEDLGSRMSASCMCCPLLVWTCAEHRKAWLAPSEASFPVILSTTSSFAEVVERQACRLGAWARVVQLLAVQSRPEFRCRKSSVWSNILARHSVNAKESKVQYVWHWCRKTGSRKGALNFAQQLGKTQLLLFNPIWQLILGACFCALRGNL